MPPSRPPLQVALGRVLKARRAELGTSQEQVAQRSGLARSYLSAAETGSVNVSVGNLKRLADALDISVSVLLERAERLAGDGRD